MKSQLNEMKSNAKLNGESQQYTSESVLKLISENDYFNNKLNSIDSKISGLDSKFQEIQDFNLECLVTKKFFNCLSCGSKKINYLPLNQFVIGDNGRVYKANAMSRDPNMFANNSNVHSNLVRNPKFKSKKLKASVYNVEFGNMNKENDEQNKFVSGQDIFTREEAQKQHNAKRHLPLEEILEDIVQKPKENKKITIKRKRPMTAVVKMK
jgi:hypothetical protein